MAINQVYIVHAWGESPDTGWIPWLSEELAKRGIDVHVLHMPNPDAPEIEAWVKTLHDAVTAPGLETCLVGHSIGGQTILRYLQACPVKVGGVVLVAPWVELSADALANEEEQKIAEPWLSESIAFPVIRQRALQFTAIFSDNDPLVPLSNASIFREQLYAEIKIEENKGHFTAEDEVETLPVVLEAILYENNIL